MPPKIVLTVQVLYVMVVLSKIVIELSQLM